jgi:hypothetical protein
MTGDLHVGMAVATIQADFTDVLLVGEGNGLRGLVAYTGVFWREVVGHPDHDAHGHKRAADREFKRQPVGPAWKEIAHTVFRSILVKNFTSSSIIGIAGGIARGDVNFFERFLRFAKRSLSI